MLNCATPTLSAKWIQNIGKSVGIKVTQRRYEGMWCYFTGKDICFGSIIRNLDGFSWPGVRGGQQKQKCKDEIEQGSRVDMEKCPKGGRVFSQSSIPLTCKGPVVSRTGLTVPVKSSGNPHGNRNIKEKRLTWPFQKSLKWYILMLFSKCFPLANILR